MSSPPTILVPARTQLGESARYDRELDCIDWVDIPTGRLHSLTKQQGHVIKTIDVNPGFAVRTTDGSRLCGGGNELLLLAKMTKRRRLSLIADDVAINDGAVHPDGHALIFGTSHDEETKALGRMYIVTDTIHEMPWHFTVFNGPAYSPDGNVVYFTDSPSGTIWQAPFEALAVGRAERHVFAKVPEDAGFPDGMAADVDGALWSCQWDGGCITRYLPHGGVDKVIHLPASRPTSLAFAGASGERMIVTTAQSKDTDSSSFAGALLELAPGVCGAPSPRLTEPVVQTIFGG